MKIEISYQLRPCFVGKENKKALFHKWGECSEIVAPSIMKGGHGGGVLNYTIGIVELEDGSIEKYFPEDIRFVPGEIDNYSFKDGDEDV